MQKKNLIGRVAALFLATLMIFSLFGTQLFADTTVEPQNTISPSEVTTASPDSTTTAAPGTSTAIETKPVEPPKILLATYVDNGYKNTYVAGETFNPAGVKIRIFYSDGTTSETDLSLMGNYTPTVLTKDDKDVKVTLSDGHVVSIPVSVSPKAVTKLELIGLTPSYRSEYLEGESYNPSGLKIQATYNDGEKVILDPSALSVSPQGPLTRGNLSISVSYGGKTLANIDNIKVIPIKSLDIKTTESPVVLGQYQEFDKSKLTVTAIYQNNQRRVVDDYSVIDGGLREVGIGAVTVEYFGISANVNIRVLELQGIIVTKKPTKLSYNEGESVDITGLEVSGIYDGEMKAKLREFTVDAKVLAPEDDDECTITVRFDDVLTDTFTVTVSPAVEMVIKTPPTKVQYYEGEAIDLTGLIVDITFKNGQKLENVPLTTLREDSLYAETGVSPVLVYGSCDASLSINVIPITAIMVDSERTQHRNFYTEGEIFDPTGIVIVAAYADGKIIDIEHGAFTFPDKPLAIHDTMITVSYKSFNYNIDIFVTSKVIVSEIIATVLPKTTYVSGQKLMLDGMVLTVKYSNGTEEVLTSDKYTTSPENNAVLTAGVDTKLVITYNNEETDQNILYEIPLTVTGKAIESIFVLTPPTKTEYTEGEKFDPTGMVVRGYFNDGSIGEILDYTFSNEAFILKSGDSEDVFFMIKAGDAEYAIKLKVNPVPITMLSITTPPSKVVYKVGESFDVAGMVITATYSNGKKITVPIEDCTVSNIGPFLSASQNVVTFTFRGKSAALSVTVEESETTGAGTGTVTDPPVSTTEETTEAPDPESTTADTETKAPGTTNEETTKKTTGKMSGTILVVFICLVAVVAALVVFLIIYYRRHFC